MKSEPESRFEKGVDVKVSRGNLKFVTTLGKVPHWVGLSPSELENSDFSAV